MAIKYPTPHLPPKTISVFRRLPESESLYVVDRDPVIYVLIKHFLAVFLSLLCILSFPSASLGMVSLSNHFVANKTPFSPASSLSV